MKANARRTIVLAAAAAFALGGALGWLVAGLVEQQPTEPAHASQKHQDLLDAYNLLTTTLEDESNLDRMNLLKTITFDRPPERVQQIMTQVSAAAANTLEQLDRYRELPPRIEKLPKTNAFGDNLQAAMKKHMTSSLTERSPSFSKRLIVSQVQAFGMLVVLTEEIERIDPNKDRREWMRRVSNDFQKMYDAYLQNLSFTPND